MKFVLPVVGTNPNRRSCPTIDYIEFYIGFNRALKECNSMVQLHSGDGTES